MRRTSNRKNPRLNQLPGLDLGEDTPLTNDEKVDYFMAKYMKEINPVGRYDKYFKASGKTLSHLLKEIRQFYKKLVLEGTWSEKKYISVIDEIFSNLNDFNIFTLERHGLAYEKRNINGGRS